MFLLDDLIPRRVFDLFFIPVDERKVLKDGLTPLFNTQTGGGGGGGG